MRSARCARPRSPTATATSLTGSKTFITNGPGADVFLVYAKIDRGEPEPASRRDVHRRARHARRHRRPAVQEDGHARLADERGVLRRRQARHRAPARRQGEGQGRSRRHQGEPRQRALGRAVDGVGHHRALLRREPRVRARAQAVRPRDRRVPGRAAQDHRSVPEAPHRREHRVPPRVDAAERRKRTCRTSTRRRR